MNIFDIIGPVMVGPSSSHTAGACKIGYVSRKLMAQPIVKAEIFLHGSFLLTGKGHGTNLALVAGLLGMKPDDKRIPYSFEQAKKEGMDFSFGEVDLKDVHPNSVLLKLTGEDGRYLEIVGESVGGSVINIASINGQAANFSGDYPTLIIQNRDLPGLVANVTSELAKRTINIATMKLNRSTRGENAVMIIECDHEVWDAAIKWLKELEGVISVTYYSLES
ncbi:MAG: L-serine ammonia-lyase, iron-sulfur-dependent subunit beta [Lachnospiraceae bacterium]|nr:L-serine ammonia-lyase, iron-sulfur-dependent subunit beta [Lachnospiraceae bacterium]